MKVMCPWGQKSYNLGGDLEAEGYPSGRQVQTCSDAAARPAKLQNGTGASAPSYVSQATYTPTSHQLTLGNGIQETTSISADRVQPYAITAAWNGTTFLSLSYKYCALGASSCSNNNGNVQSQGISRPNGNWTDSYGYDALNRLISAQETGTGTWGESYQYDNAGNRWLCTQSQNCPLAPGRSNLPDLTLETPQSGSWYLANNQISGWGYDLAGNVTSVGGMVRSFTYDAENRQLTAAVSGGSASYAYDAEGRRVTKTATTTSTFVYDAFGQLAAEYGGPAREGGTKYLTADVLGSVRLETPVNATTANITNFDYLPFGQEIGVGTEGRDGTFSSGL